MKETQTEELVTFTVETAKEEGQELEATAQDGKDRKQKFRIAFLVFLIFLLVGVALFAYYRAAMYYKTHFFPNTSINGIDCSNMEAGEAAALLDEKTGNYVLEVIGRDISSGDSGAVLGTIAAEDIGLNFGNTREAVEGFLAGQEAFKWIMAFFNKDNAYYMERDVFFDKEMLENQVKLWEACNRANMKKPRNAYIDDYSEELGIYEIVSETQGTEMDVEKVIQLIADTVDRQETELDLEEQGCYTEAAVKQDDRKLTDVVNTVNKWLGTKITYDWNGTKVILDYKILHEWITMENGKSILDEEKVSEFVKEQASAYDTYGKKKNFVTTSGVELTLASRNYGWKTDTKSEADQLIQLIYQGKNVEREPVYSVTARQKGINDIGSSYVEADLTSQHLYLYQDGELVIESDFVSGTMVSTYDCVTPEGIFGLTYKTRDAVLKGATYRTPVSYWMPFFGNYGMHDAKWRGSFGGQIFITNGSHGCINLPPEKAAQIYQYVSEGFPVICYYTDGIPYIGPTTAAEPEEPAPEEGEWEEPQEPAQPQQPEETPPPEETLPPAEGITQPIETPQPPSETPPSEEAPSEPEVQEPPAPQDPSEPVEQQSAA